MTETALAPFLADPVKLNAIVESVDQALTMCDASARCVGVAAVPSREPGTVTGLIGVHGAVSGFVTVNFAERAAMALVGGLLQDNFDVLTAQVIDGVGEITNIISGGLKKGLAGTPWAFSHLTVPSVIVGQKYQIAYCRGLDYLCATFDHTNEDAMMIEDRLIQISLSLIKL